MNQPRKNDNQSGQRKLWIAGINSSIFINRFELTYINKQSTADPWTGKGK